MDGMHELSKKEKDHVDYLDEKLKKLEEQVKEYVPCREMVKEDKK